MSRFRYYDGGWNWENIGLAAVYFLIIWLLFVVTCVVTYAGYCVLFQGYVK